MISKIVPGVGMGEDRELIPIENQPLRYFPEILRINGQLAAAPRMWADGSGMKPSYRYFEEVPSGFSENARLRDLMFIEVDVCMEIDDADGLSHPRRLANGIVVHEPWCWSPAHRGFDAPDINVRSFAASDER